MVGKDGERSRLTTFSSERWGGKVYSGTTTEDLPWVIENENEDNTSLRLIISLTLVRITQILYHYRLSKISYRDDTGRFTRSFARSLEMLIVRLLCIP